MKKQFLFLALLIVTLVLGVTVFCFWWPNKMQEKKLLEENQNETQKFHQAFSVNKESYGDIEKMVAGDVYEEKIYGGIVSHHLITSPEIASFFFNLKQQSPQTVVIIGPNHFNAGNANISISAYPYKTPWGTVYPENDYVSELIKSRAVYNNEDAFTREHSISALVSFVSYYLPNTKIVPIIIKKGTKREDIDKLAQNLDLILSEDDIVVASVDFSHHLDQNSAEFHDKMSVDAIGSFDYDRVLKSEIDSPASINVLLKYLEGRGKQKMVYKNINSADISKDAFSEDVTSYVFARFFAGEAEKSERISVLSFGDMMLSRDVEKAMQRGLDPFDKIRGVEGNFLRGVDFISANFEGAITDKESCPVKDNSFVLKPDIVNLISKNNINLLNLANNHISDCGKDGLSETRGFLSERAILAFGDFSADKSSILKEVSDKKIVFVGIDSTVHSDDLTPYAEKIKELKRNSNYVVVNVHWGFEYHKVPSGEQIKIAHILVDSGADLIIGHHPHVVQSMEIYKDKAIFYSVGNFIFDQIGEGKDEGIGVGAVFEPESTRYFIFPYNIKNYQPVLLPPQQAKTFCDQFLQGIADRNGCDFEVRYDIIK
jgi:poly-gamma-glutamate synthesis protein (capsule biosynthesis protein)